jgi:glycosyltransferase involved in cell wall biosynthesis
MSHEVNGENKLRILSICQAYGAGVLKVLSQIISSLGSDNFEHHVVWSQREETPADWRRNFSTEVRFHRWECQRQINPIKDPVALYQLLKIIRQVKPDLIHAHSSKAGLVRLLRPFLPSIPIIYTPHAFSFLQPVGQWQKLAYMSAEWVLARFSSDIIGVSASEADSARKLGLASTYISNMCDVEAISHIVSNLPPKARPRRPLVGMAGRGMPQKNPGLFIDVARRMEGEVDFLWIGDLREQYLIDAPANLTVTGWLEWEQVIARIAQLDIYLHTALWEGMPMTVLEAMATKRPVIAYPAQGTIEAVQQGVTGLLTSDSDGFVNLIRLMQKFPEMADAFGQQGYNMVTKNFGPDMFAKQWTAAYVTRILAASSNKLTPSLPIVDVR